MTTATGTEFFERRNEVIEFVKQGMLEQGASEFQASMASVKVEFFKLKDVENLHRCINSDLPSETIKAIVAHDFNGLAKRDKGFSPKSAQFDEV